MMRVVILGRGRVGKGLASAARKQGVSVSLRKGTSRSKVDADLAVLAVPDHAITDVAQALHARANERVPFVHCSGSRGVGVYGDLDRALGVMHPLVSFADPKRPPSLVATTFVIAGDTRATRAAQKFTRALEARVLASELHGPAYHAVAAMLANGAAGLGLAGTNVLVELGASRRESERALAALLRTVADNIERVGLPAALTGPIMRGDAETIARHRAALRHHPDALAAYDGVAPAILECAENLSAQERRALRRALKK